MCCCAIYLNTENIGWKSLCGSIWYLAADHIAPKSGCLGHFLGMGQLCGLEWKQMLGMIG